MVELTIIFKNGDIFSSEAEALVNTVNCEGYMGKGLAYQFKKRFPQMEKDYKKICEDGQLRPGKLHFFHENKKLIINFPTKDKWRAKSRIEYIDNGLTTLKQEIVDRKITSIAIPPLGSGNGGLNWNEVKQLINFHLSNLESKIRVEVYEPSVMVENNINEPKSDFKTLYLLYISEKLNEFKYSNLEKTVHLTRILSDSEMNIPNLKLETNEIKSLKKYYNIKENGELYLLVKNKIISDSVENLEKRFEPVVDKAIEIINTHDEKTVELFINALNLISTKNEKKMEEEIPENIVSELFAEGLLKQDIFENVEINYIVK